MTTASDILDGLKYPLKVWGHKDICSRSNPVPTKSGAYACYFRSVPSQVPVQDCVRFDNLTLLYIGISPAQQQSKSHLRNRIRTHYTRNASASTLRFTLGCLLADDLDIQLRRTGRTQRLTFTDGEQKLSEWMSRNMYVVWRTCDRPWSLEVDLINSVSLPLNLNHNQNHKFHPQLSEVRRIARQTAKALPIVTR